MRTLFNLVVYGGLLVAGLFLVTSIQPKPAPAALPMPAPSLFAMGQAVVGAPQVEAPTDRHKCPCVKKDGTCPCTKGQCGHPACPTVGMEGKKDCCKDGKCKCKDCGCKDGKRSDTCPCGPNCPCVGNKPATDNKPTAPRCPCSQITFEQGLAKAKAEKKPLVLWVGCCCPVREKQLPGCVHCYEETLPAYFTTRKDAPYVIVGNPSGSTPDNWRGFPAIPSLEKMQSGLGYQQAPRMENTPRMDSGPKSVVPDCSNGTCPICPNGNCPAQPAAPTQPRSVPQVQEEPPVQQYRQPPRQQFVMPRMRGSC